jgi:two-component system, cell cycle sensor histidine kinase and response regulator CckA
MHRKSNTAVATAELRDRVEERLMEQRSKTGQVRTKGETQRFVHELQVHQIELEMQKEELQKARDDMEAALGRYSDLYDFAPVGYLTLDREGTIREANLTSASLLAIERSRLIKRHFGLNVSASDLPAFTAFLTKVFESKVREFCEVTLLRKERPPVEVRIEAGVAASGRECHAVLEDLTEHKRAEEDRLILNKLESTGILAEGIAHDFNNLLTGILLNLELGLTLIPPGEELAGLLEQAKQAALTSGGLTQQLLSFARGGAPIRKLTHLSRVIQQSARLAVSGSRVRCDFSLARDLYLAEVDVGQIGLVIRNLVLNAREAMPKGGVIAIRAENVVLGAHQNYSLPPGDYVLVSIADRGAGIPKEVLSKIFDPYFSTKQRGNQKGMGLGLAICHTVIQKHRGAIAVDSEMGVGTTFRLHLPASRKLPPKEKASRPASLPQHRRILVMNDEERVRKLVGRALQRMGHEVQLVGDEQQAVEVYASAKSQRRPFDAVLLDLTVRVGVGGQEAIGALLKIDPAVKVIVMSGYANAPLVLEPERHGFKGVLAKPFDIVQLREVLSRVLGPMPDN